MFTNSSLKTLKLRYNNFSGTLPSNFSDCKTLEYIDLRNNWLQGLLSPSLAQYTNLKLINCRRNNLTGEFPILIHSLPVIEVLDLSSNNLHGQITDVYENSQFPMLRILDLSNNYFSGMIPTLYIKGFRALMNMSLQHGSLEYIIDNVLPQTYPSIVLTYKGNISNISGAFTYIDLSNNTFEGELP